MSADTANAPDTASGDTSGTDAVEDTGVDHGAIVSLVVDPPNADIEVVNGAIAPTTFTARATYEDNFEDVVNAVWTFDRLDVATVGTATGELTPVGRIGGQGTLTATIAGGLEATADVTVRIRDTIDAVGVTSDQIAAFETPDTGTPSGKLLYPYDQTMFARGILAPEVMWEGGAPGDLYRIHVASGAIDLTWYVQADPPSTFVMDEAVWIALTESTGTEPVEVSVQRQTPGVGAYAPMTQQWFVAQGSLRGTIYYWAVNRGQLMRIKPGAGAPETVFDAGSPNDLGTPAPANYDGTTPPWTVGTDDKRCVSCHTVSRNGNAIAAVFETKNSAPSPWGLIDLVQEPTSLLAISDYNENAVFLALDPPARWTAVNRTDFTVSLVDNTTGAAVPTVLDGAADNLAHPTFAPDGSKLAVASNVQGSYPVEYWVSDLDVLDFDDTTGELTNRRQVVAGNNTAIAFPNFSPDGEWLFYQRGDYSRAKYGANGIGHNDLYMNDVAGVADEIRLDALNGDAYLPPRMHGLNYEPRVNPITVGGYTWVVFFSPRDYGHKMQSTTNPTYENRKQLWVSAVNLDPQPGEDPSHPGFWLPGQDLSTINMSAYWALEPCRSEGTSCAAGYECCTGFCQDDGAGNAVCVPPTGLCSQEGEACTASSDCCGDPAFICVSGFCSRQVN